VVLLDRQTHLASSILCRDYTFHAVHARVSCLEGVNRKHAERKQLCLRPYHGKGPTSYLSLSKTRSAPASPSSCPPGEGELALAVPAVVGVAAARVGVGFTDGADACVCVCMRSEIAATQQTEQGEQIRVAIYCTLPVNRDRCDRSVEGENVLHVCMRAWVPLCASAGLSRSLYLPVVRVRGRAWRRLSLAQHSR